jgi:predicted methyltransferase
MRLTEHVHQKLRAKLKVGDIAIDATTGNGHDTLFLAECIGKTGKLFAFDIQQQALEQASIRFQQSPYQADITWIHAGHQSMLEYIPKQYDQHIQAVTFNLGYLPKGDKSITTSAKTTIPALEASLSLLANHGVLSIMAYTGHVGGRDECEAIKRWAHDLSENYHVAIHIPENTRTSPPEWICIEKQLS